jgi:hypothetical protein
MWPVVDSMAHCTDEQLEQTARLTLLFITSERDREALSYLWRLILECHTQQAIREMRASPVHALRADCKQPRQSLDLRVMVRRTRS